jgi:hypothetical protein
MIKKWSAPAGLNEGDFAAKWRREWGDAIITRIEVIQGRRGGLPPDTNGLEGKNGGQKGDTNHVRRNAVVFAFKHAEWMSTESILDLSYGDRFNQKVWNNKFFQDVQLLASPDLTHVMQCSFPFDEGRIIIPSNATLNTLICTPHHVPNTVQRLRFALTHSADGEPWLTTFKKIARDAESAKVCSTRTSHAANRPLCTYFFRL